MFQGCFSYYDVEFKGLRDVQMKNMSMKGMEVELEAVIYNPNNYKITLTDYDLNLLVGGKNMGKANIDRRLVLPKNSTENQRFTVQVSFGEMLAGGLGGAMSLLSQKQMEVTLEGHIKAKAKGIKRKVPISFTETVDMGGGKSPF